jgi:hypothetical protein
MYIVVTFEFPDGTKKTMTGGTEAQIGAFLRDNYRAALAGQGHPKRVSGMFITMVCSEA